MKIKHQNQNKRAKSGFLFLAKTIGTETRWLEWAKWEEEYSPDRTMDGFWFAARWL